jgi:hypothetical protein
MSFPRRSSQSNCIERAPIASRPQKLKRPESLIHWPVVTAAALAALSLVVAVVGVCLTLGPRNKPAGNSDQSVNSAAQLFALTSNNEAFGRIELTEDNREPPGPILDELALSSANAQILQQANDEPPLDEPPPAANLPIIETVEILAKPEEPVKERVLRIKHRDKACADDLAKQLLLTPVVRLDLDNTQEISSRVISAARRTKDSFPHPAPLPLMERPDLSGLPIRMGIDCHLGKEAAENLDVLSQKLRNHLSSAQRQKSLPDDTRINVDFLRSALQDDKKTRKGEWEQPEAIPTLVQMLMPEDRAIRMLLVELLAKSACRQATQALTQRALFDLSADVREAAIAELKNRPAEDYCDQLIAGFRYPWPPAADHAAEALIALDGLSSIPQLIALLDMVDPVAPRIEKSKTENKIVVKELVRVNHLSNCLMCHAPSFSSQDLVRGNVPVVGQSIDAITGGYGGATKGTFVRADITYLKQDFSVQQPVAKHGPWPANQRFDYMVRTRPATLNDVSTTVKKAKDYPQREAVLFALRELTGEDLGKESSKWRQLLLHNNWVGKK